MVCRFVFGNTCDRDAVTVDDIVNAQGHMALEIALPERRISIGARIDDFAVLTGWAADCVDDYTIDLLSFGAVRCCLGSPNQSSRENVDGPGSKLQTRMSRATTISLIARNGLCFAAYCATSAAQITSLPLIRPLSAGS